MLIRKPRPLPIRFLRWLFYLGYNPAKSFYHRIVEPKGDGVKTFVLNSKGQILLLKIGYAHKSWVLPGGSVDRGEIPLLAARRELWEESGIDIDNLQFLYTKPHTHYHAVQLHYYFGETSTEEIVIDNQEIIDGGWFDVGRLPEPHRPKLQTEVSMFQAWLSENEKVRP